MASEHSTFHASGKCKANPNDFITCGAQDRKIISTQCHLYTAHEWLITVSIIQNYFSPFKPIVTKQSRSHRSHVMKTTFLLPVAVC